MNKRSALYLCAGLAVLAVMSLASTAFAQAPLYDPTARPMFAKLPPHSYFAPAAGPDVTPLTQWTFTFTYNGGTYNDVFIGTNPASSNVTTKPLWGIIPIKMVYGSSNGNKTFDPNAANLFGTMSATQMILNSTLYTSDVDYDQGGTDLGKTQYEDAYMRGNFWEDVKSNTSWHILFPKAVVAPEQTLDVPSSEGSVISNPWSGIPTGTADINWFDEQLQTIMAKFPEIKPNTFPVFMTVDVYLTEGGCCIGGYHSANAGPPNGQTYAYTTTIQQDGSTPVFSQDIGALSHEVGEWLMDPFTTNRSPCGILEVGDPLETEPNFGDFPYTLNGFTYHPQDLVLIDYFGASTSLTVNGWYTFQNETNANGVCTRGS